MYLLEMFFEDIWPSQRESLSTRPLPLLVHTHVFPISGQKSFTMSSTSSRCDVLNLLRIQFERQYTRPFPSVREYAFLYGMNRKRMEQAKDDILIMAPGPINRGVEITPDVADGPHSVILHQVTNGIAVRMAALYLTTSANQQA